MSNVKKPIYSTHDPILHQFEIEAIQDLYEVVKKKSYNYVRHNGFLSVTKTTAYRLFYLIRGRNRRGARDSFKYWSDQGWIILSPSHIKIIVKEVEKLD